MRRHEAGARGGMRVRCSVAPSHLCLVQIKVPCRPGDRFLRCLLERFLETAGQRVVAPPLGFHRLLEQRLSPRVFGSQYARRLVELRLVRSFRLPARDKTTEIGVDDQQRSTAGAGDFDLALQLGHDVLMIQPRP